MATCTVSGKLLDPSEVAIVGANVRFNIESPSLAANGADLLGTKEVSTTTGSDGTWSLLLSQTSRGILTIEIPPNSLNSAVRYTFSLVIPATSSATFSSVWADSVFFANQTNFPINFAMLAGSLVTSQLPALNSAQVWVGNAINVATGVSITGDISLSNAGLTAIVASSVSNSKLANMGAHTYKGNNTGSSAAPLDLTGTQVTADLSVMVGDSGSGGTKGLVPAPSSGDAAAGKFLKADGTYAVPPGIGSGITALTGDVTASGSGSVAATIANNAVTNAKAAQMAAHSYKGNNTGSTANAIDLTATQLTAELNNVVGDSGSGGTKGLVPAPGAGDAAAGKFLKADGTFAVPAGGGGGSKQVVIGTAKTTNLTCGGDGVFHDFTTGPTVTFTASASAKYKVYISVTVYHAAAETVYFRIDGSGGAGTPTVNLSQEVAYDGSAGGNYTSLSPFQIVTLVSGTSYTFSVQGKTASGTITLAASILAGGVALVAEQIG